MYVFNGLPVRSGLELVSAMRQHWTVATDLLDNWPDPPLKEWLRTRPDGDILILALDMEKSGGARLIRLQAEYDPDGPLEYQGVRIDEESIDRAIDEADPSAPETGADLVRFIQIEIARPRLDARVEVPRPPLSSQLSGHRLDPFARAMVNEIESLEKRQLQSSRDQLKFMEEETKRLQNSPAVKAYGWLRDIRTDRILRSMAAVVEGPAAARLLHADQLLSEWSGQTESLLNAPELSPELYQALWMANRPRVQSDPHFHDMLWPLEMARAAAERPRTMLAYLFKAALADQVPTDESAEAIESAQSLLETISAIEELAPVSRRSEYGSLTRDPEVRKNQMRVRQSAKELAEQIHTSLPTDLGRLVPAFPVMEMLGAHMQRELAEHTARQRQEAEARANAERARREAQQRADQEAMQRATLVDEDLRRFDELGRQDRKWRAVALQTRVSRLAKHATAARENATNFERKVAELRKWAAALQDQAKSQLGLQGSGGMFSVQSEIDAALQDLRKVEISKVAKRLRGLEAQRVKAIISGVQRVVTSEGTPDLRALDAAESEVWAAEQLIEEIRWDQQRITHVMQRLDTIAQRLAGRVS